MIALPPVDPADFIMKSGDELKNCFNAYFNEISLEDATRGEALDPKYAPELLEKMQSEYQEKLRGIWDSIPIYMGDFDKLYQTLPLDVAGDPAALQKAYAEAVRRTLWEKLGNNYKDVMAYKLLLKQYAQNLLQAMHNQFVDIVAGLIRR